MKHARGPESKPATKLTRDLNAAVQIPLWDEDPERALAEDNQLVSLPDDYTVWSADGRPVWTLRPYSEFLDGDAPDTVNPSLWRNAKLNMYTGLFQVVPNAVYQVRGMDLSNISFLEDPAQKSNQIVVVDPLVSEECAAAALALYYEHRPKRPIGAVIYTHCHVDHYGGVSGLFGPDGPGSDVTFVAPAGFLDHAVSENVFAGVAMGRRATFMYGIELPRSPQGQVDAGLGKTSSVGTTGIIAPTCTISADTPAGKGVEIAGVTFEFQLTPDTEAPAEMNFYLPDSRALCIAENATPTLHNIYSLRGAQVRDAKAWSQYLNNTVADFGDRTDYLFASHFWPREKTTGNNEIVDFLTSQADLYRFLHDQALRDSNQGQTMIEVAEDLDGAIPPSLASQWFNHGYYGTANHNLKAVYQRYLGWFDGNAAHLHTLPPEEAGRRYVEAMGGRARTMAIGAEVFADATSVDDYRWAAELLSHVVFGYPDHPEGDGRHELADVLEQLGYLAESGPWRNFFLAATLELRTPTPQPRPAGVITPDMMAAMSVEQVFDYMGLRLNGLNPVNPLSIGLTVLKPDNTVLDDCWVRYRNTVLVYTDTVPPAGTADSTYRITRTGLSSLGLGDKTPGELQTSGDLKIVTGSMDPINALVAPLVTFYINFPLTRP